MLLILTTRSDLTTDYVIAALRALGHPYFRLNAEDVADAGYHVQIDQTRTRKRLEVLGRGLDFGAVTSVWYRRQLVPGPSQLALPDETLFAQGELTHLVEGLLPLTPDVRWIDDPETVRRAERKLRQFDAARAAGFAIPSTLVSTSVAEIQAFMARHPDGVICKPIFRGLHMSRTGVRVAYTRLITADDLSEGDGEMIFPLLVQQFVPKVRDLRITVVGKRIFPVEVVSAAKMVDWRHPDAEPEYRHVALQPSVGDACLALLDRLGLSCGAFDLAQAPDGRSFFLEVNPVGEWAWLDRHLSLGIRDVVVEHLVRAG